MQAQAHDAGAALEFASDVRRDLSKSPQRELHSKYLYDAIGSALFEAITLMPEYGLTRADERVIRDNAVEIRDYPVRVADIDLFDHMNNAVYWTVIEDYLYSHPELLAAPLRVTIEHDAAVALGDKLEILSHVHPAGSTDRFGADLSDRTVTTLTYTVGDDTKAIAALFAL